ncbi:tetratricopeptide repeat protein [candidate division WWE3 bacterium]|nr:tetratricopeptide repeat protein [candidate division WWE3 bacterium]
MEIIAKPNIKALEQKAINFALLGKWKDAIKINKEIIDFEPENVRALTRMGLANLQLKDFKEAEKLFKKALKLDPINSIVKKNLELAKTHKVEKLVGAETSKKLVKEPGTSTEEKISITGSRVFAESFVKGDGLLYKLNKTSANIYKDDKLIGIIESPLVLKLHQAKELKIKVTVEFSHGKEKEAVLLFRAEKAIFKASKQDVKPYMKKDSLDEDEENTEEE